MKPLTIIGMLITFICFSTSLFAHPFGHPGSFQKNSVECGIASTYSSGYQTANGERYNPFGISAAHKYLPFGTRVIVRQLHTRRSVLVRINDRGPFIPGRIIDLSTGANRVLGMDGIAPVCLEIVSMGHERYVKKQRHVSLHKRHHRHKHVIHRHHRHHHKKRRIYREDEL